jgi:iron complex transport system substrate-binding protein
MKAITAYYQEDSCGSRRILKIFAALLLVGTLAAIPGVCPPLYARLVLDQLGRRVELPEIPRRVVSLAPSITEMIFALDQAHRLKGVTQFSDFPAAAESYPKVGSYVHLDLEKIVALKPDLCIAVKDGNPIEVIERLEALQVPVYAVDPRNLETVMATLREIGALLNADEKAEALVHRMQARIRHVKSRVAGSSCRPRVFFQIGISPIVSVGTDTFIHEIIGLAGGKNLAQGPIPYPRFSREQVVGLAPDVFIITSMDRSGAFEKIKSEWDRWPGLPAVKNGRIYLVDSNLFDRPSPRLVDALELLARLIHPERFKEPK